ncbi:TIP41-like family-domain-containing protein [Umbelopsis sp. PMI_123]|nr:TIP41-like family-domain-containing protein [Umbelopsis sp. PMI_123]
MTTSIKPVHKLIDEGNRREGHISGIEYNGWTITSKKAPICNSQDIERLQKEIGIPLPEMIFGKNEVNIRNETGFELKYGAEDALQLVDKTSQSNKHIKVAYANEWGKKSSQNHEDIKDVIKPYDWTYSTSYKGTSNNQFTNTDKEIDIERLKRLDPILFYDENILFEDELADNGTATLTTRLRVMPTCFFLLLRFFLRVDDVLFRINDTRIYHEFGTDVVIREYTSKEEHYNAVKAQLPKKVSDDISLLTDANWVSTVLPTETQKVEKQMAIVK